MSDPAESRDAAPRLVVRKTYKLLIGGRFVRGESGRVAPAAGPGGATLDQFCLASRKDLRDAVVAARSAFGSWSRQTPYLRGQILYRAAEMLEGRADELAREVDRATGSGPAAARREVVDSVDRLVHYAGWTDKFGAVFGSVNPVASPHFNISVPEPTGVVAVVCPDEPSLLALVSLVAPVILSGNTAVVLASETHPLPALTFSEIIATSDLPAGVCNLLAGRRSELAPHIASHLDIQAVVDGSGDAAIGAVLAGGAGSNLKRVSRRELAATDWTTGRGADPYWILDTIEWKTAWHPVGQG